MAALYSRPGRKPESEYLFKLSMKKYEKTLGPDHPDPAGVFENLADFYKDQGRRADAEKSLRRAAAIRAKTGARPTYAKQPRGETSMVQMLAVLMMLVVGSTSKTNESAPA